jgi:hypothetical protein
MKNFATRDRVLVSSSGGWKKTSAGTIVGGPEPIDTLKGPECYYWVEFDEPQEAVDGDDAYSKSQILSCYLDRS